ncbi:MAG: L,D-transpeptidase family protein [Solirubrobacteraceae bacterium]
MRSRSFIAVAVVLVVLLGGAGAVLAYDSSNKHTIAKGVKVGGVDVGGMNVSKAQAKVRAVYRARFERPVVLRYHGQRFVLSARAAHITVDVDGSVQQALDRSRSDNLFVRTWRSLTGGSVSANIDPDLRYSEAAVKRLVSRVSRSLYVAPRNASISYSGDSIGTVESRTGISVRDQQLTDAVNQALTDPNASRHLRIPVVRTPAKVTSAQLAAQYPAIITVDRSAFTLKLWKGLKMVHSYQIAVGQAGLETPAGLYHIQDKEVNPSWHVPNSAWAGSLAGQTIPPGPQDPIKARWMGIFNGAGIHGTEELGSLGSAASHGCIRMAIPDVEALYDQVSIGTPVYIA